MLKEESKFNFVLYNVILTLGGGGGGGGSWYDVFQLFYYLKT